MATFRHPFTVSAVEGVMPPGTYRVVMDEEEILGLSFLAFRRVATSLHVPAVSKASGHSQLIPVDQAEFDAALSRDQQNAY
jgi:hypothetical protein